MDQLDARGVAEEDVAVGGEELTVLRIRVEHPPVEIEGPAPPARAELGGGQVRGDPRVLRLLAGQRVEAAARLGGRAPGQVETGLQPAQPRRRGIVGEVAIHHRTRLVEPGRVHEELRIVLAQPAVVPVTRKQRTVCREGLLDHAQARQDARPHHLDLERVGGLRRLGSGGWRLGARDHDRGPQGQAQEPADGAREAERGHRASMAATSAAFKGGGRVSGGEQAGGGGRARTRGARAPRPGRPHRARPGDSGPRSRRP